MESRYPPDGAEVTVFIGPHEIFSVAYVIFLNIYHLDSINNAKLAFSRAVVQSFSYIFRK